MSRIAAVLLVIFVCDRGKFGFRPREQKNTERFLTIFSGLGPLSGDGSLSARSVMVIQARIEHVIVAHPGGRSLLLAVGEERLEVRLLRVVRRFGR
eukprot:scaffold45197_cov79-Phaeocystis_antarctica.AAC.1